MEGSGGKPVVGPTRTHNRRRHSGLLLHFTDLPSWNEEQARRREEKRRKSLAEIGPEAEGAAALYIPSLQEISARAAAVFESFTQVDYTTVPDVIVDMVRGYMDKDAQIRSFRCYRDYYPATVSSSNSSSSSLSSLSSSSQSGAATHKRRRSGASSPVVRLLQQPNKTTLLWTVQHYNHNGQLDGESLWYFRSGQKACQEHYRLDQLHGPARTWYKSGKMESEREWSEGQLQGHSREWYPDGKLKTHELWQRGVREKVLVADGRKLTDRARECLFGTSRLRVGAHALSQTNNSNNGSSSLGGLPGLAWLSLDGGVRRG